MNNNLVVFFNDGQSDNLNERAINLIMQSLGDDFSLLFRDALDEDTKKEIAKSTNTFAYVNPYWNPRLTNVKEHHLKELLKSLSELASQAPNTTLFITPYTTILGDLGSREYDFFYSYMSSAYNNNNCPANLLVAKRENAFYGKLTSQYQWLAMGKEINKSIQDKSYFDDMYRELKTTSKEEEILQEKI